MYSIYTINERNNWEASGQEFSTYQEALGFACAECGVPWLIVSEDLDEGILAAGDVRGLQFPL